MFSKYKLFILLLFLPLASLFGQQDDSLAVVGKQWSSVMLRPGVIWKQGHFDHLFESRQEINFIEIDLRRQLKKLRLAADSKTLRKTSDFAKEDKALLAINGGFFDVKNGGAVDFIRVDKQMVNPSKSVSERANATLAFSKKKIAILPIETQKPEQIDLPNVMLSGPLLLLDGKEIALKSNAFNANRHPRTAIAITNDNKLILIVVDGRNAMAQGMNLTEVSKVLKWLGAKDAMNLDGGGSSAMYIREKGIVSYPSDNKKFDHEGERSVANIVYLK